MVLPWSRAPQRLPKVMRGAKAKRGCSTTASTLPCQGRDGGSTPLTRSKIKNPLSLWGLFVCRGWDLNPHGRKIFQRVLSPLRLPIPPPRRGLGGNRTHVRGFAVPCLGHSATRPYKNYSKKLNFNFLFLFNKKDQNIVDFNFSLSFVQNSNFLSFFCQINVSPVFL